MNAAPQNRKDITTAWRERLPAPYTLSVSMGGPVVTVASNDERLMGTLRDYFREFVCPDTAGAIRITALETAATDLGLAYQTKTPDPGKTKIKEEYRDLADGRVVRKRLTGMVFVFGEGDNLALGPCRENVSQVINFVNNRAIEHFLNQGCLLGHAAGVSLNGRGLALAGFSGMGKSTLALRLMSLGATFVSNDRVLVAAGQGGLVMHGVPKQPRVNPGTLLANEDLAWILGERERGELAGLPKESLWQLEQKHDALIVDSFGPGRFVLTAPLNGLVILNWRRGGGTTVAKAVSLSERLDLLPAFIKDTGLFYLPHGQGAAVDRSLRAYAALLSRIDVIEIDGGADFDRAGDICRAYLETGRPHGGE